MMGNCSSPCAVVRTSCLSVARFSIDSGACERCSEIALGDVDQGAGGEQQCIRLADLSAARMTGCNELLADEGEVRAVVGGHGHLLHPHARAVLDNWEATGHRPAVRRPRLS